MKRHSHSATNVYRTNRPGDRQWRELARGLLLAFLLLLAQQSALLHELSHHAQTAAAGDNDDKQPGGGLCELCLAFSQVDASAAPQVAAPALAAGLTFAPAASPVVSFAARELASLRNRGPPAAL